MCDEMEKTNGSRTMGGCNSVVITGTAQNPLIYRGGRQLRFGFWIRTTATLGKVTHLLPIQLRGQVAYDGFMQYQFAREVNVRGYLESPRQGGVVVIGTSVFWGRVLVPMTTEDLAAKLKLLKSIDSREQAQSLDVDSSKDDNTAKDAEEEIEPDSPTVEDGPKVIDPVYKPSGDPDDLDRLRDRSGIDFDSEFTEEEMVYRK